jgi:23S rRNA (pseudouridine1915-N3)-methyltransferase
MKITLLQVGKTKEKYIEEGIDNYSARLKKYIGFELIILPDIKNARNLPVHEQKIKEGSKIIKTVTSDDYVVILDEKGKEFSTVEFAAWIEKKLMLPKKRIVFVIGGAWGLPEAVRTRADILISLSRMTFPHQMVRLLFLEQLYRVLTIIRGEPYHHE